MRPWLEIFIVFYLASIIGWVLHDLDEWDEEKMKMPRPGLWSYTFWGVVLVNVFWMLLPVFYLIC